MRLFYRIDGTSNWAEIEHTKAGVMAGDFIVCHTEDLRNRFLGEQLVMGVEFNVVLPDANPLQFNKAVAAMVFFTKPPATVVFPYSNKNDAGTDVVVTFPKDWFDAL